jgi:hypothetical protein
LSEASSPRPRAELLADQEITLDREESKYAVEYSHVEALLTEFDRRLSPDERQGDAENGQRHAEYLVTNVYFDTPSRSEWLTASAHPDRNVKLRAREYRHLRASLPGHAADPSSSTAGQPWIWFELKRRERERTSKRRFRVRQSDLPLLLSADLRSVEIDESRVAAAGIEAVIEYSRCLGEPLSASSLVNYRRLSWQDPAGLLRVTLDLDLAFHSVPPDLWTRPRPLVPSDLGPSYGLENCVLVEVKRRGPMPSWVELAIAAAEGRSVSFSKFIRAGQVLYGRDAFGQSVRPGPRATS